MVRLSVGIEDLDDIIGDLQQALTPVGAASASSDEKPHRRSSITTVIRSLVHK